MLEWAEDKRRREEININILLSTDYKGMIAWHLPTKKGLLNVLQKIWEWPGKELTREEINNKLLLATDNEGRIA